MSKYINITPAYVQWVVSIHPTPNQRFGMGLLGTGVKILGANGMPKM